MGNNYCFTVTQYNYTDEDVVGTDIIRIENLSLARALQELTKYVIEHPDCYASNDGFISEHEDESIFGVTAFNELWSAQISYNEEEN